MHGQKYHKSAPKWDANDGQMSTFVPASKCPIIHDVFSQPDPQHNLIDIMLNDMYSAKM
jgi:ABC-type enterochelin transport system substrate-binding protein